jgi:hypothetical protein
MKNFMLLFILTLIGPVQASFAGEPTFGPEFNFKNPTITAAMRKAGPTIIETNENAAARDKFLNAAIKKCPECSYEAEQNEMGVTVYKVLHPDGWYFVIAVDPGVVEVQAKPMTLAEIEAAQPEMQRLIFNTAREIGLYSDDKSGHIHMGLKSAVDNDPLLFRNFIVDWVANSRMTYEVFGAGPTNAPTIDQLDSHAYENFLSLIAAFDEQFLQQRESGIFKNLIRTMQIAHSSEIAKRIFMFTPKSRAIHDLIAAIIKNVYFTTTSQFRPTDKFQNLNLSHPETVEARGVHEVASAHEYFLLAKMLHGRLDYLKHFKTPISFDGITMHDSIEAYLTQYQRFTADSGLDWQEARQILYGKWKSKKPRPMCENILL